MSRSGNKQQQLDQENGRHKSIDRRHQEEMGGDNRELSDHSRADPTVIGCEKCMKDKAWEKGGFRW